MPDTSPPALTPDQQAALAAIPGLMSTTPQFVAPATMTVDDMLANFPASAPYRGKYVRVSDYGGFVDRVLRCDYETGSGLYFWTPTTPDYGRSLAVTGNMTLLRLKSPPSVVLTGTIGVGVTRQVTIDTANGRPGEIIEIRNNLSSLLGTLNIGGLGLGSLLSLALGGYMRFVLDSSGGSLQLVRLQ